MTTVPSAMPTIRPTTNAISSPLVDRDRGHAGRDRDGQPVRGGAITARLLKTRDAVQGTGHADAVLNAGGDAQVDRGRAGRDRDRNVAIRLWKRDLEIRGAVVDGRVCQH